jgi:methionyl-tRNA formyltransferase
MAATAVVFAYHDVGARCLPVLLDHGIEIPLVVTHRDDPKENIWFASVAQIARERGLEVVTPDDPNAAAFVSRVRAIAPDFLFSFYYRHMLSSAMLATAKRGTFNMHGSLLPKYRGRAPVNWAVLEGERETGATLHEMVDKPDAGRIVGQASVPILEDDLAVDVFGKVAQAARHVLDVCLPGLLAGTAKLVEQDFARGSYRGGRKPEDGRIDWTKSAREIHDLVRAVAPPYPGAFTQFRGKALRILRTKLVQAPPGEPASLRVADGPSLHALGGDGVALEIVELDYDGERLTPAAFCDRIGPGTHRLELKKEAPSPSDRPLP